jgi:hypothetical protein
MQDSWLRWEAGRRFDGEVSRTLRWALDQARAFSMLMMNDDPVEALDRVVNPDKYDPPAAADFPSAAEREADRLRRELAIRRAFGLGERS